jgi:hypothetical protein
MINTILKFEVFHSFDNKLNIGFPEFLNNNYNKIHENRFSCTGGKYLFHVL